jgi:hypothetical protein
MASLIEPTHCEESMPRRSLSYVRATSGTDSMLQQITLASKWQENILKGLLG